MAEELTEEQEFESAWNEEEPPESDTETHDAPEEDEGQEPEEQADASEEPEADEEEETPEERQRRKSWEGRLRKREEELRAKEQELLALHQQQDSQKAPEKEGQSADEIDEDDPEWQQLVDDLGEDLALRVRKQAQNVTQRALQSELDKVRQELNQQIAPLTQQQQQVQAKQHVETIQQAHPDAFDLVQNGEIQAWVESQPRFLQSTYQQVIEQGSAEDVIDMLNTYKQTTKQQKAPPERAVKSRRGGRVRTTAAPKDDFDAAWDEAMRE